MTAPKFRMMSAQESGIGGFLLFFVIVMVINLIVVLLRLATYGAAITGSGAATVRQVFPAYPAAAIGELIFLLARFLGIAIGLVLIFRRNSRTPAFFVGLFGVTVVVMLVNMYVTSQIYDAVLAAAAKNGQSTDAYTEAQLRGRYQNIGSIIWSVVWLQYWRTSERVRLTFTPGAGMTEIRTQT